MGDYRYIRYETLDDGVIARITLDRPRTRNAQNRGLLVELGDAFLRAEADDTVRVVILCGAGPMFSFGHDMGSREAIAERQPGPDQHPSVTVNGDGRLGAEGRMLQEWHYFFENTRRWRNLRKITIASVQGAVYAAGLMLMWACDLIVAADNVIFADVVGTRLGMCGVEYFAHPWEFGLRSSSRLGEVAGAGAQHVLLDLPGGRLGQGLEVHPVGRLEVGQPAAHEVSEITLGNIVTAGGHEGHGPLAPARVRHRHHGRLEHIGVRGERLLHLDRCDVLPAADDDVLAP